MSPLKPRLRWAMGAYVALAALAMTTLDGAILGATLILLAGLALKTWIAVLKEKQQD